VITAWLAITVAAVASSTNGSRKGAGRLGAARWNAEDAHGVSRTVGNEQVAIRRYPDDARLSEA
jgi:hypothetical protein